MIYLADFGHHDVAIIIVVVLVIIIVIAVSRSSTSSKAKEKLEWKVENHLKWMGF